MMVSPFFAGRGNIYFYNLMDGVTDNHKLICGDYLIVQRHPYGEAPSASSKCKCFPDSCLVCPSHPSSKSKEYSSVKCYAPSDARMIQISGHFTDRDRQNWEMKNGNIQFNGIKKLIKFCAPFETDHADREDVRLLAHFDMSEEPATDISSNFSLRNRNLSNGGVDDEFTSFLSNDMIRNDGCTASFGFVKDEDMTWQMRKADSNSWLRGQEFGFEFVQLELCIGCNDGRSPASAGLGQTEPKYSQYRREVIIGIKVPVENEHIRVASGHTLRQALNPVVAVYARDEEEEVEIGTLVAEKYEIAPPTPMFLAPMETTSRFFKKKDETPLPPHIGNVLHAGSQYERFDNGSKENGVHYGHGHGAPAIHVQPPTPVEIGTPTTFTCPTDSFLSSDSNAFVQPHNETVGIYAKQKTFEPAQYEQWLAGISYSNRGEWSQELLNWVTRSVNEGEANSVYRRHFVDADLLVALRDARNYMIDRVDGIYNDRNNRIEAGEKLEREEQVRMLNMYSGENGNPANTVMNAVGGKTVKEEKPVNEWTDFWSVEKWDYKKGTKEKGYWGTGNIDDPMEGVVEGGGMK